MARHHAEFVVEAIFACMEQSLHRGERIEIRGFGTFKNLAASATQASRGESAPFPENA
jgi:nucleoid DNA-binding protein